MARFGRLARTVDPAQPGAHPRAELLDTSDHSLLHALFYAVSNADLETLLAVDRGALQDRVVGGSALVAERLAADLDVRLATVVTR